MTQQAQNSDAHWMRRALALASRGYTPPNPMVGCIIVRDGACVGAGYHPMAGQPHAEVFALRAARERARGATVYLTLEPCTHWGRTPPCVDALIDAGVKRVVIATEDVDVRVAGNGVRRLRAEGIWVDVGLMGRESQRLNEGFFHFHRTARPFVVLKYAMTLDGKIATYTGDSRWITGPAARRWVHRLRGRSGAVMVGIGTLLADDALLTARGRAGDLPRQPLRIVVDSHMRIPVGAAAVRAATADPARYPLLVATTSGASTQREAALRLPGVEVLRLPATDRGRVDLRALSSALAARGVISVLCEGGGELAAGLLAAGLVDKLITFIAPKVAGGRSAPTPVGGEGVAQMADALALSRPTVRRYGPDIAIESYIERVNEVNGYRPCSRD